MGCWGCAKGACLAPPRTFGFKDQRSRTGLLLPAGDDDDDDDVFDVVIIGFDVLDIIMN